VADDLPAGTDLADLGWRRLADPGPAEHVWQLGHRDLHTAFPPLRSLGTYRHNLPVELTSFVPRDAELAELTMLIAEARLVTLTGSGGCGKICLALHAAAARVGAAHRNTFTRGEGIAPACQGLRLDLRPVTRRSPWAQEFLPPGRRLWRR
jgi:hypothetical protein